MYLDWPDDRSRGGGGMNIVNQAWPLPHGRIVLLVETSKPLSSEQMAYLEPLIETMEQFVRAYPAGEDTP